MDSEAQTAAYAAADFSESNSLFTGRFAATFSGLPETGRMADLGCGPGDIAVRMARAMPGWSITGLDAGENMLKLANERLSREDGNLDVRFRLAYLPDDSLEPHTWDALISNSLLHHLPHPGVLWDSIARLGRPGAAVQVMDLARPDSERAALQLVDDYSGDEPEVLREDFYNSLLAAYTVGEVREQLARAGLSQLDVDMASDRHWVACGNLAV
jgi:ubiquinone/menaquinone biosynthesis C-methylase UbiE